MVGSETLRTSVEPLQAKMLWGGAVWYYRSQRVLVWRVVAQLPTTCCVLAQGDMIYLGAMH